jgi:hypothetical protein
MQAEQQAQPIRLPRNKAVSQLVHLIESTTSGEWTPVTADVLALRLKLQKLIKDNSLSIRKSDYKHVIERAITLITTPDQESIDELKVRHSFYSNRQRRVASQFTSSSFHK